MGLKTIGLIGSIASIVGLAIAFYGSSSIVTQGNNSPVISDNSGQVNINSPVTNIRQNNDLPIRIKKGMLYVDARKVLIEDGWQTVRMHQNPNLTPRCWKTWDETDEEACQYEEIDTCSGTGGGLCIMYFFDANSNKFLWIRTIWGEPPEAQIDLWEISTDPPQINTHID